MKHTIEHNGRYFRVEPEFDHFDYPAQDGASIDVYRSGYGSATESDSHAAELFHEALHRLVYNPFNTAPAEEKAATITNRLLSLNGDSTRVYPHSTHGYSQGDWADILVLLDEPDEWGDPAEAAEAIAREWEQWSRGDVWFVTELERDAAAHFAICETDSDCECWTESDNTCGFIIADSPEAAVAAIA